MPFATRSVMVNAPVESIWNALKDAAENPGKYVPSKVEEIKIHETSAEGLLREVKSAEIHRLERVAFDQDTGVMTFTLEQHPLYSGTIVHKVVAPEDPGALPILTFTMDLTPRTPNADQQPGARWFLDAATADAMLDAVTRMKEAIEARSARYTTTPMSRNQQLVREMFLAGESMHVENFVRFYNDDARYQFSNFPVAIGPQGIIGASQDFIKTVKYCVHHIENLWEIDESTLVCEMTVDYVRTKDLKKFTLPCCDTIRVKGGKVQDLRIFMDIMPIFAD